MVGKIRQSVGAIIFQKNKYILLERCMILARDKMEKIPGEWDLLKGGIDAGETPEDAVLRELYEETGSKKYKIIKKYDEQLKHGLPEKTGFSGQEVTIFLVEFLGNIDELKSPSEEIGKIKSFSKEEAIKKIKYPETREFFMKHG